MGQPRAFEGYPRKFYQYPIGSDTFSNITIDKSHHLVMFFLYDWIAAVAALFAGNPLLLVFFLGIIGNVLPFVPTPSLLFIVVLAVTPGSGFEGVGIIEIASIAALGATLGKLA